MGAEPPADGLGVLGIVWRPSFGPTGLIRLAMALDGDEHVRPGGPHSTA
jgi:hypothetical protein